jgi:signal transduction histidine kinase
LGLALTKRIVEAQGGTVGVKSDLGKGSVFFALLPLEMKADSHGR